MMCVGDGSYEKGGNAVLYDNSGDSEFRQPAGIFASSF